MDIHITNASLYSHRQTMSQITSCAFLGLIVSGLDSMDFYTPDGILESSASNSSLFLVPADFRITFSFNARRENYVTLCQIEGLSWNPKTRKIELELRDQLIEIPPVVHPPVARMEQLRDLFRRTVKLVRSAINTDHLVGEMLMQSVVAEFAEYSHIASEQVVPSDLEKLKKMIDEDLDFKLDLADMMAGFKYTSTHLRRLFQRYYQTNPAEYRARLRFNRIQQLLVETDMTSKEIADAVGMNHVTHLHSFIRQRCGLTPVQLRRNLNM
ncbi:MAG: helix-turn-helix transcriptional regulator [Lentisphaeria bacterium]|nr:helix-turn-helix transcriptional regulator [Lentisphaeria bacterium]